MVAWPRLQIRARRFSKTPSNARICARLKVPVCPDRGRRRRDLQMTRTSQPQQADGLYDPRYEHDACGVAVVARLSNEPGNDVIRLANIAVPRAPIRRPVTAPAS